jgi:hypothetical protein
MFKDGQRNVHDEEQSGWPSAVSEILFKALTKRFVKDTLHNFRTDVRISTILCTAVYEIITVNLGFDKFLYKMASKNAYRCTQTTENGFRFDFLERYHKYGNKFLSHVMTDDETLELTERE